MMSIQILNLVHICSKVNLKSFLSYFEKPMQNFIGRKFLDGFGINPCEELLSQLSLENFAALTPSIHTNVEKRRAEDLGLVNQI